MTDGRLKRADNVICREIDGEIVVIKDDGLAVHVLNKTAARIWEMCDGHRDPDEITASLCERYDVNPKTASTDVRNIVGKLMAKDLLKHTD